MRLILVRHADAEPTQTTDRERRLTGKGRDQAAHLAGFLQAAGLSPDCLLTSPFVRARQTAEALEAVLAPGMTLEDEALAAGVSPPEAADFLRRRCAEAEEVILVGHEPDLSSLCAWYLGAESDHNIKMKKAAAALLEVEGPRRGDGVLHGLVPPKLQG
jgi:phosphohistidine phosphatase